MTPAGGVNRLSLIGLIPVALGLLLHTIGLATPAWSVYKIREKIYFGLFHGCEEWDFFGMGVVICGQYTQSSKSSKLWACEALSLIGLVLAIAALASVIFGVMGKGQSKLFTLLGGVCSFVAFGAVLTTVLIWAVDLHEYEFLDYPPGDYDTPLRDYIDDSKRGYSFGLSVTGCILLAIGGALVTAGGVLS